VFRERHAQVERYAPDDDGGQQQMLEAGPVRSEVAAMKAISMRPLHRSVVGIPALALGLRSTRVTLRPGWPPASARGVKATTGTSLSCVRTTAPTRTWPARTTSLTSRRVQEYFPAGASMAL